MRHKKGPSIVERCTNEIADEQSKDTKALQEFQRSLQSLEKFRVEKRQALEACWAENCRRDYHGNEGVYRGQHGPSEGRKRLVVRRACGVLQRVEVRESVSAELSDRCEEADGAMREWLRWMTKCFSHHALRRSKRSRTSSHKHSC